MLLPLSCYINTIQICYTASQQAINIDIANPSVCILHHLCTDFMQRTIVLIVLMANTLTAS